MPSVFTKGKQAAHLSTKPAVGMVFGYYYKNPTI
jgi:hypothetical protein